MKKSFIQLIIILLLLIGGVSCSGLKIINNKHKYSFVPFDSEQLTNFIKYTNNINPYIYFYVKSENYAIPEKSWVKNIFIPNYRKFIFDNDLSWYSEGDNDCTEYSNYSISVGQLSYFKDKNKLKNTSLCIGSFSYLTSIYGHVIVVFVVSNNGKLELAFFEPQYQSFVEITDEERKKCLTIGF